MITADLIAYSTTPDGNRLSTFVLKYPRFIHSEFMTHRCFSRNASSSRAIPIEKMLEAAAQNTACPEHWGVNKKGMQADEHLSREDYTHATAVWRHAQEAASH